MGCLNVDVQMHKVLSVALTSQYNNVLSVELTPQYNNMDVAVVVSSPQSITIRDTKPLEVTAKCVTKHLNTRLSIVCGVGIRGGLFDIDGLLLFDSDNNKLFESE
jgi:hypothetical protein